VAPEAATTTRWRARGRRPVAAWALGALLWLAVGATRAEAQRRFTTTHRCTDAQRAAGCLIVLGSGTPVPDPARAGAAYAFVFEGRTFLFDAGAGVMRRAAEAGLPIDGFTGVFLTHLHSDHTLGLPDVLLTSWVMGRRTAMSVVGPPGTRTMVEHLLAAWGEDITVRTEGLERGQRHGERATVTEVREGVVYDSAGVRITAIRVPHGNWAHAFAWRIDTPGRRVVLSGDTAPSDALAEAARGADVLVHEGYPASRVTVENRPGGELWPRYLATFHASDEEVGALARRAGVRQLVLSHLVRMGGTDAELLAGVRRGGYAGPVAVAQDLDVY
jgi:ribonuclease BN (tRNA processing enzyme)